MDFRKLLAVAALVLLGMALEAALLHWLVAAPLASAIRATRSDSKPATAPCPTTARGELAEEIEVASPRRADEPCSRGEADDAADSSE